MNFADAQTVQEAIVAMANLTPDYWDECADGQPPSAAAIGVALGVCASVEALGGSIGRAGPYNEGGIALYVSGTDRRVDVYNDGDEGAPGPSVVVCRTQPDGQREYLCPPPSNPDAIAALLMEAP